METEELAVNSHYFGLDPIQFEKDYGLRHTYKMTATTNYYVAFDFASAYEGLEYPLMAVTYHPEKPGFIYTEGTEEMYNHSEESIQAMRDHWDAFVRMTRKSSAAFDSYEEELEWNIENWNSDMYV
jgi:hypothetical protein